MLAHIQFHIMHFLCQNVSEKIFSNSKQIDLWPERFGVFWFKYFYRCLRDQVLP
jgi:hypothetical protein